MSRFSRLRRGPKMLVAVCLAGATFGIVSAVQAAIPDANGVIHGCYQYTATNGSYGKLRVYDTSNLFPGCNQYEKPLNWNQTGVSGATGPTGPTGPAGPTGATGAGGVSGYEVVEQPISATAGEPDSIGVFLFVVHCPTGKVVTGGGANAAVVFGDVVIAGADLTTSVPVLNPITGVFDMWEVGFAKRDGSLFAVGEGVSGVADAVCIIAT